MNWEVTGDSVNNTLRTFRVGKQNTEYSVFLFIKCHKLYPCVDSLLIKVSSEGEYRGKERETGRERDGWSVKSRSLFIFNLKRVECLNNNMRYISRGKIYQGMSRNELVF